MAQRPWRVLYTTGEGPRKYRSKSFSEEPQALNWAKDFVRGSDAGADAHVYAKVMDEDHTIDPVPASYRVAWINGSVSTMTWPEMPRAQYDEWNRQMLSKMLHPDDYAGPQWVPEHFEKVRGPLPGPRRLT